MNQFDEFAIGMTRHACMRAQQRGVKRDLLNCLLDYGHHEPDHKGCNIVTFDGKAFEDLSRREPTTVKFKVSYARNIYAVVDSDGIVITAGHRYRRVRRNLSLSSLRPNRSRRAKVFGTRIYSCIM